MSKIKLLRDCCFVVACVSLCAASAKAIGVGQQPAIVVCANASATDKSCALGLSGERCDAADATKHCGISGSKGCICL